LAGGFSLADAEIFMASLSWAGKPSISDFIIVLKKYWSDALFERVQRK
jgi:hypothetical protein